MWLEAFPSQSGGQNLGGSPGCFMIYKFAEVMTWLYDHGMGFEKAFFMGFGKGM